MADGEPIGLLLALTQTSATPPAGDGTPIGLLLALTVTGTAAQTILPGVLTNTSTFYPPTLSSSSETTIWGGELHRSSWQPLTKKQRKKRKWEEKKSARALVGLAESLVPNPLFAPETAREARKLILDLPDDVFDALSDDDEEALIFILLAL
jgi:hypothetical protein